MPKKGNRKRLKYRGNISSETVTVADYADSDPAIVKTGRIKKAVANAIQKEVKLLCGLEASQVPVTEEALSSVSVDHLDCDSSDEVDVDGHSNDLKVSRKKKSKRQQENVEDCGQQYPIDIWLFLASYIRPEDVAKFALICKNAWTVTCTAAFWTRLYRRYYCSDVYLPVRLQREVIGKLGSLRACVIRSLYHMYEPFRMRISEKPAIPESTPNTLQNCSVMLAVLVQEGDWKQIRPKMGIQLQIQKAVSQVENGSRNGLQFPRQYEEVHTNPDQDCYLLQITTLNFIFTPVVMGMTLALFTISVSTDMRHHRVRMLFQDSPLPHGKKPKKDQGLQVVLDPVHSVRLLDWWHPQFPFSASI